MSPTSDFAVGDGFARVLTETTMSLVCVLDQDGRIVFFNDACERVTGFTREEVMGGVARNFGILAEGKEAFGEVLGYVWKTGLSSPQVGRRHALRHQPAGQGHAGDSADPAQPSLTGMLWLERKTFFGS